MDNSIFVLLLMIFLHIVADFNLQGILVSMKQKSWWKKNAPDDLYEYDYMMALGIHAFSWTFMIMLPIVVYFGIGDMFLFCFVANLFCHYKIDNAKANEHTISLFQDQLCHLVQIITTYMYYYCR